MLVGPVSVAFAGVAKSAWNLHALSELLPKFSITFGAPAAGSVEPSMSEGRTPPKALVSWKHSCVAGAPASMAVRS